MEFYFTFKLGKNIKRITPLNSFSNSEAVFKESIFMLKELNIQEIIELNLQFSSKIFYLKLRKSTGRFNPRLYG